MMHTFRRKLAKPAWLVPVAAVAALSLTSCNGESLQEDEPDVAEPESCNDPATLCTWAGTGEAGFDGDGNPRLDSMLYWPVDLTFTSKGDAYVLDWNNHAVRLLQPDDTFKTVIGTGFVGDGPLDLSDKTPPGAAGTDIDLNHPTQLLEQSNGHMLLVSWHNHKLRDYDPKTGLAYISCGSAAGFAGDGAPSRNAQLNQPTQALIAPDDSMFILDMRNQVVRKIDPAGVMHTVAGTPQVAGYAGDGGVPTKAQLRFPSGSNPPPGGALALDGQGRLYISDTLNHVIRRVDFKKDLIETVAGTGKAGFGGDGGPGTSAKLNNPRDLELSPDKKTLYIADELNHRIRALDLASLEIETVAGTGKAGTAGTGSAPTSAQLNRPSGLEFDNDGMLYIADTYNHRIVRFDPAETTP